VGYGVDHYCLKSNEIIRALCHAPQADVHYLVGGTQANKTAIGAFLRPWEAVISAESGHIQVHEAGAIEHNGHRLYLCPAAAGKLTPDAVRSVCQLYAEEETAAAPKLVYISNTTELGTVYSRAELEALRAVCDEWDLYLYCDGARLACAMAVSDTDFADYAAFCDAFTIGGTKNGLLFGEALVITNPALMPSFRRCLKQQGAMLAKGRLLGVQYIAALENGLYMELANQSMSAARQLREGLQAMNIPMLIDSPSNQLFPILPTDVIAALQEQVEFEFWSKSDEGHSCIRFVTAWHTTQEEVSSLLEVLKKLLA
jgi:threonine aldolase